MVIGGSPQKDIRGKWFIRSARAYIISTFADIFLTIKTQLDVEINASGKIYSKVSAKSGITFVNS